MSRVRQIGANPGYAEKDHFQKEEEVLFSMARQTLDEETQIRLGKAWAEARRVTIA